MNALTLVLAALCVFALGYRYYGIFIANRVLGIDSKRATPAHALEDGIDYCPTNKYVLFGHHFAAIAAAGPLLGPVLAAQFGYLPARCGSLSGRSSPGRCTIWSFSSLRYATKGKAYRSSPKRRSESQPG